MSLFHDDSTPHSTDLQPNQQAAPAAPPAAPPGDDDKYSLVETSELAQLRREVAELRAQSARTAELQQENERLAIASAARASSGRSEALGSGAANARRDNAIRSAGGNAKWYAIPVVERCKLLGVDASQIVDSEVQQIFGKDSSSASAQYLARTNPSRYAALRVVAIEKKLI